MKQDTIILVDDDVKTRNILALQLRKSLFDVDIISSGFQLLNILEDDRNSNAKLIIIHNHSADMPATEIVGLASLIQNNTRIPFFILLSEEEYTPENIREYEKLGVKSVFAYNYKAHEIVEKVRILLKSSK